MHRLIDGKMLSRRELLRGLACSAALMLLPCGCVRHRYHRPPGELDLGALKELLYDRVHIRSKAVLLFRDIEGWYALSARCTYEGCDLTFHEPVVDTPNLLCSCCRTRYNLQGLIIGEGAARDPLPWIDLYYRDGHLYANPGKLQSASWRFMSPEIRKAEEVLRQRVKPESLQDEVKIPDVLKGDPDREPGPMFLDEDPNLADQLKMIK